MRIVGIGAGPANLYFSILMKKAFPEAHIRLLERNPADATFGWGVVFSDETLGHFEVADPETYARITREFAYWTDIDTWIHGECIRSTGHGFCGMSRRRLLQIFQERCEELGVDVQFDHEVTDIDALRDCDLLLGGDGVHSLVRERYAETFKPTLDWRKCKFTWLGTAKPLEAFTFIFRSNEAGLFQVHAYPFEPGLSTFIVECHEDTWKRAGLDEADQEQTVAYFEALFSDHLDGHRLLSNNSIWRTFPTIRNGCYAHENVVLLGDAAHTAHFSIGSGTKLAMEDAISLVEAFRASGTQDVPKVLAQYENSRRLDEIKLQKSAQPSMEWFENSARYVDQAPIPFTFNLMTRSKRVTWDNLALRDPAFIERVARWFAEDQGLPSSEHPPVPMFTPFQTRGLTLANRVVVSPMCMYSATDGTPDDWHLVHLGAFGVGGSGLVITEATGVLPEGRITPGCTGLYSDENEAGWKRIVDFIHTQSAARVGIQLCHAGRKASCSRPWEGDQPLTGAAAWETIGPSDTPFGPDWPTPRAMTRADMDTVIAAFVASTERASRIGFDLLELHMAHGYLLSSFVSPLSNLRSDEFGGSLANRARFPLEVLRAVRKAWGDERPLFVRISATDWLDDDGGLTIEESVEFAQMLKANGCDVVDVSTAGNVPDSEVEYGRMYQVPFAERIRHEAQVPVMAVGAILGADHVNTIIAAGRADLCAMARPHLINPHLTLDAAGTYFAEDQAWPKQYAPARPRRKDDPPSFVEQMGKSAPRIRHARRYGL